MKSQLRRGFTLIELLIVMAIMALVAGMLFPAFSAAKAASKTAVTLSNIRQLGIGFQLYESDYDDGFPSVTHGRSGAGMSGGWVYYSQYVDMGNTAGVFDVSKGTLFPYVRNKAVYVSANDVGADSSGLSFAFNGCLINLPEVSGLNTTKSVASVQYPTLTMLLGEEGTGISSAGKQSGTNDGFFNPTTDQFAEWHDGKTAVVFVDGHAKTTRAQSHFALTLTGQPIGSCW
ncbi:MAG: prepilin-type N-terminal cleavage/methylation domain-containing protein [Fimbriimonas sp.]|nr:prepilin-type N-terminal cleavage/methylation domain-containing protein [Fimbriimonas sp.]